MVSDDLLTSKDIQLALTLKTNQLKREKLASLTYRQVSSTLTEFIWKHKCVTSINDAINDIMRLDVATVVSYLSLNAIEQGSKLELDSINGILGGELND